MARALLLTIVVGCAGEGTGPTVVDGEPRCDGRYQIGEGAEVDQVFDVDDDGFVDGANAECAATFDASVLDCDDADPQRHPGALEVHCNGKDDDCNEDTPDGVDLDRDGFPGCLDCDDRDPLRSPGVAEICWDFIDNDCDGVVDPECGPNYNGTFELEIPVTYGCESLVAIDFLQVDVLWNPPDAAFVAIGGGQPGTVNGTIAEDGSFDLLDTRPLASGLCSEVYHWVGQFTSVSSFDATFSADYFMPFCQACADQEWTVHGERVSD